MKWNIIDSFAAFFPNGEPIIFYRGGNPFHSILDERYGNIYFLIVAPNQVELESFFFFLEDILMDCYNVLYVSSDLEILVSGLSHMDL